MLFLSCLILIAIGVLGGLTYLGLKITISLIVDLFQNEIKKRGL
jgi:hypothetical protein